MPRGYPPHIKDKACILYEQGYTLAEICDIEGFPRDTSTVSKWLKRRGIPVRNPYARVYPREEILAKLRDGVSRQEIVEEYKCSLSYLSKILKEEALEEQS